MPHQKREPTSSASTQKGKTGAAAWCVFVLSIFAFCAAAPAEIVINEIDYDQPGTDDGEFVEILNVGSTDVDLGAFEIQLVNGASGSASAYRTLPFPDVVLAPDDYFVVCGDSTRVAVCDLDVSPDTNLIQNGAPDAIALLRDGVVVDTVSYEGDTGPPFTEGSGAGLEDSGTIEQVHRGLSRFPDGTDTDRNNVDFRPACITPGSENTFATGGCTAAGPSSEVFQIQGAGSVSPLAGQTVHTPGNVVTAILPNGFFMQTPAARSDADIDTSDGIFVATGAAPGVMVGDVVSVTGSVRESSGLTQFAGSPAVEVVSPRGGVLPDPVVFDASVPSPDPQAPSCAVEPECYEGMRVEVGGGTVTGPSRFATSDPVGEAYVVAGPARAFREPGVAFPGLMTPPIPTWDGNPEVFALDPDRAGLPNLMLSAGSSFEAVGVLGFQHGDYTLVPASLSVDPAPLFVPVRQRGPGEFTIGTLNLFRLFDGVDDPARANATGLIRDDEVVDAAEYARRRAKLAAYVIEVLNAPDVLVVQEAEKLEVLDDLARDIAAVDGSLAYRAFLLEGNDAATLDVGFLVRDTADVAAVRQLGADETLAGKGTLLHDRPPLLLEARLACPCAEGRLFRVLGVHLRSLTGIEDPGYGPFVREKRLAQAESVARMVQSFQSSEPEVPLVVIGDFNAFEFTDGFVDVVGQIAGDFQPDESLLAGPDLVEPNLTNLVKRLPATERYSYVFRGSARALDHALASASFDALVRDVAYGRGNADAAEALRNDASTPLGAADHDGLVLYLARDCDGDGISDDRDVCPCTGIPESVPTARLGKNRLALTDGDEVFDTSPPRGRITPRDSITTADTAGCSCAQIIDALGLGRGHEKFGCSRGAVRTWIDLLGQ